VLQVLIAPVISFSFVIIIVITFHARVSILVHMHIGLLTNPAEACGCGSNLPSVSGTVLSFSFFHNIRISELRIIICLASD